MLLSRHSVGTYSETSSHATCQRIRPQSSQLADPLWTDPGTKSGISVCELIYTSKQKTKQKGGGARARNEWSNILPKSSQARKKPPPPSTTYYCGFSVRLSRCRVPGVEHLATELTVQRIGQLATNSGQWERAVFFLLLSFLFCFVDFLTCCLWNCIVRPLRILGQSKNQWAAGDICCITFVWMWRNMWNTLAVVAALLLKLVVRRQCISACASSTISPSFSNSLLSYCHSRGNLSSASSSWSSSLFVCT